MRFVPYHLLGDQPNVIVDGSAGPATALTLSHWPGSPTPPEVRDDLSAQIALHALDHPELLAGIEVVSNNHFDQDGLCSAYVLIERAAAVQRRDRVIDVARAGDFGTFTSRDSARLAMAIAAYDDPALSPLGPAVLDGPYPDVCGRLYETMLPLMSALLDDPERSRPLWEDEDARLGVSIEAIADATIRLEEVPELDLAIVTIPADWQAATAHRFTQAWHEVVHPMAVNNATAMLRVLLISGDHARLELRYESWVMLTSRPVMPRPDLRDLAASLDALEPRGVRWHADAPGSLTPMLQTSDGRSDLGASRLRTEIERFLNESPAAWDPFQPR